MDMTTQYNEIMKKKKIKAHVTNKKIDKIAMMHYTIYVILYS